MGPLRTVTSKPRLLLAVLVLAAAVLVVTAPVFMLAMAPAIALFALVAHRIMPGAERIVRLRRAAAPARRPRVAVARLYDALVPRRAGRLIAAALAVRPPPAAPVVLS